MILNEQYNLKDVGAPSALTSVVNELTDLCSYQDEGKLDNVVAGVSAFLASDSASSLKSPTMRRLLARALRSVGERELAGCALVLNSGLLKVRESAVTDDPVYVLDLARLSVKESEQLDMVLAASLLNVLETIAWVWDASSGCGVLGIRNVEVLARSVLGPYAKSRAVQRLSDEIKQLCRMKIKHLAGARGWDEIPALMQMDLC